MTWGLRLLSAALLIAGTARAAAAGGEAPSIRLRVNSSLRAEVTSGTPLVFEVLLFNEKAREAMDRRLGNEVIARDIERRLAEGKITRQEAERRKKGLAPPAVAPGPLRVRLDGEAITFLAAPDSPAGKLPWSPKGVPRGGPAEVELDAGTTAAGVFVVPPEAVGAAPGAWRVAVRYRGPGGGRAWSGEVASNAVIVQVVRDPGTNTARILRALATARYHLVLGSHAAAAAAVEQALALEPGYPDSLLLLGEVREAGGDFRGAIEAYNGALSQMRKRRPAEAHEAIRERMRIVRRKIGNVEGE